MADVRVGIVGQSIDATFLAQAWREMAGVEMVPLETPDKAGDMAAIARAAGLRAVTICSAQSRRFHLVQAVLAEGLPVLAETPWALDVDSLWSLIDDRGGSHPGTALLPVTPLRFASDLQMARGIVQGGGMGDPVGFTLATALPAKLIPRVPQMEPLSAAALVMEQGWPAFDLARFLFGDIHTLQATRLRGGDPGSSLEAVEITLHCSGGWTGRIHLSVGTHSTKPWVAEITGSEGGLQIGWEESFYCPRNETRARLGGGCLGLEPYRRMAQAFADVLLGSGDRWATDADHGRTIDLIQATHMSLGAGLAVTPTQRQRGIAAA